MASSNSDNETWSLHDSEGYHVPSNSVWPLESSVNTARELYETQPVSGSNANTAPWRRDAIARTNPLLGAYCGGSGDQQSTAVVYSSTGSSDASRGSHTVPNQHISPPGHGFPGNWRYNDPSGVPHQVYSYNLPVGGHDSVSSYATQSALRGAERGATSNNYALPVREMPAYAPQPASNDVLYSATRRRQRSNEYSVACPYRCGTVLTGVHALGNLTRHLKSQTCTKSGKAKGKYPCPIEGCGKVYIRSDGLRVHMRKHHGAPPAPSINEEDDD